MTGNSRDCHDLPKIAARDIGGARLVHAGRIERNPRWHMHAHAHPFHEIIVVMRGRMEVVAAGERYTAGAGAVMLYPAGVAHEETSSRTDPVATVFATFEMSGVKTARLALRHDETGRIRQIVQWLYDERFGSQDAQTSLASELLHVLLNLFFLPARRDDGLRTKIREYVRPRAAGDLTLEELAGVARLSRFNFVRTYRAQNGRTPMADVRSLRADMARDLLLTTSLPIKEIAPRVGLGNEYAMSRIFVREFGMRPGEFRRHAPSGA
jgi:AraC-like DNA-binding protein